MNHIRLKEEQSVFNHAMEILQAEYILEFMKTAEIENQNVVNYRKLINGQSLKITAEISPELSELISKSVKKLRYEKPLECYIINDYVMNAISINLEWYNQPNIIVVSSHLINSMSDKELEFVIGHEIGHLIIGGQKLSIVRDFLFSDFEETSPDGFDRHIGLINELNYLDNLMELSADRFGLIACDSTDSCFSAFMKLYSGINFDKRKFNLVNFLNSTENILTENSASTSFLNTTHPIYPIRIQAIKFFAESELYKAVIKNDTIEDVKLFEKMSGLCDRLKDFELEEESQYIHYFIAAAGIIIASLDGSINEKEADKINMYLSRFVLYPQAIIDEVLSNDVNKIFEESLRILLKQDPKLNEGLIEVMIDIAISDGILHKKEKDFIFNIGKEKLGLQNEQIAYMLANKMRNWYRQR
ncbi:MAG: M48 family metallopeptidase [Candidatus Cloacimonetes bacterium]|nr:M48 family metallopeptidase [Candidatus Cloacimonadota bacterium]